MWHFLKYVFGNISKLTLKTQKHSSTVHIYMENKPALDAVVSF